jgi:hypothetical protein
MSAGKGHAPRPINREGWETSKLWKKQDNARALEGKSEEDLKKLNVKVLEKNAGKLIL